MALRCISLVYALFFCRDGHSVLVHGSEGTDSTLLVSSLAQLILDPASRTLTGFLCLLEKEWIQVNVCLCDIICAQVYV